MQKYDYHPIQENAIKDAVEYIREQKRKIELWRMLTVISLICWIFMVGCLWMR